MEESIFCGRRNLAAGRLDRMDFSDPRTWIELKNRRTKFSPIYSPKISTPESFTLQFENFHFFFIIPLFRLVFKKVLQKVAVKNLSTKSNAQLLGIKFRCALMRPSRASLAHAAVNLTSLHWSVVLIGCTSFNYWVESFATYVLAVTFACWNFLIVFKPAFKVLIAILPVQSFYVFSETNL